MPPALLAFGRVVEAVLFMATGAFLLFVAQKVLPPFFAGIARGVEKNDEDQSDG